MLDNMSLFLNLHLFFIQYVKLTHRLDDIDHKPICHIFLKFIFAEGFTKNKMKNSPILVRLKQSSIM